jgi:hypothetical protein
VKEESRELHDDMECGENASHGVIESREPYDDMDELSDAQIESRLEWTRFSTVVQHSGRIPRGVPTRRDVQARL